MKSAIFKTIIIGLTAAGLASCSDQTHQFQGPLVDITVTESNSGAVTITVDPYELDLIGRPENQPLMFKLTSKTFRYVQDAKKAIEIASDPDNQFSGHVRGPQGKMMTVKDRNSDNLQYHYTLRIEDDSGRLIALDPLIKNGQD